MQRFCSYCKESVRSQRVDAFFCSAKCRAADARRRVTQQAEDNRKLLVENPGLFFRRLGIRSFKVDGVDLAKLYINKRGRPAAGTKKPGQPLGVSGGAGEATS